MNEARLLLDERLLARLACDGFEESVLRLLTREGFNESVLGSEGSEAWLTVGCTVNAAKTSTLKWTTSDTEMTEICGFIGSSCSGGGGAIWRVSR